LYTAGELYGKETVVPIVTIPHTLLMSTRRCLYRDGILLLIIQPMLDARFCFVLY